jgi:hypothetical protein
MVRHELDKALTSHALAALHPIALIRNRNLKAILCQVDSDGRSIHGGLLLFESRHCSQRQQSGTSMPRYQQEESISSSSETPAADSESTSKEGAEVPHIGPYNQQR